MATRGWKALLLDGGHENSEINLHQHFLTSSNICGLFATYDVPKTPDYISIDVDSIDLWLFKALLEGGYRASVFTVEYNPNYPLDVAITTPNDPNYRWMGDRAYGASLRALTLVANAHDYSLLGPARPRCGFREKRPFSTTGPGCLCSLSRNGGFTQTLLATGRSSTKSA